MNNNIKNLELPTLAYAFNALEPHIDALTMEIHFTRHHKAYFDNLQNAVAGTELENMPFDDSVLKNISKYPAAVRNNGGGHFNHSLFWTVLSPNGGQPDGELLEAINKSFGSFDKFKETFSNAAKTRFGSGWAWLSVADDQSLIVSSTPNQDNPLMDVAEVNGTPILGLDVWEHAYYLKYQNKRPDYVSAFWNVINWDEVTKRYEQALVG